MKKIYLLFVLAAAGLLAVAGAGCSAKAKKSYYLERADRWFNDGQFEKAEVEYLNVLHSDPQNGRAYCQLGIIYYNQGRFQKAAPFLFRGGQLDSTNLDAHVKLGEIYLALGNFKEAHNQAESVLEQNPRDPQAPILFAQSVAKQNEISAARQRLHPLIQMGDDPALETAMGILASRERDFKTATADFQRALAMDSHFAAAYVALGKSLWQQNEIQNAETAFKAGADCAPVDSPLPIEYGRFEIQSGHIMAAGKFFAALTAKNPDYVPAWLGLAEVALDEKNLDGCSTAIKKALARDPDNVDARVLDARLELARSDVAPATAALEQLAKKYPQAARIHYQLALAYVTAGRNGSAARQLREAVGLDPGFQEASFLLAQLDLQTGDLDSGMVLLKGVLARDPGLLQARLLMGDAYRLKNDFADAQGIFQQLEKAFPKNPEIPLLSGSTYLQQSNENAAREQFNRVLQIQPGNETAQEELAELDLADRQFAAAQQRAETLIQKDPSRAAPEVLLAKVLMAQGQTNQAEAALSKATTLSGGSPANVLLAQLYFKAGQDARAMERLNATLDANPTNTALLMLAGIIQSGQKNYRAAADAYEKLLAVDPQNSPALNNLAWIYCDNLGGQDKAYDLAQRAHQLRPADPSTCDTLGWIDFKKGQYAVALKLFQESANGLSGNPDAQFHLGIAHYMLGDEDASRTALQSALSTDLAFPERSQCEDCLNTLNVDPKNADAGTRAWLEKKISQSPDDPIAFARLAAIYQRDKNLDKEIALCQTVLKASPRSVKALVLLAQLSASSNPQKAYALAKTAYQLRPDDTEVCATLGRLAWQNGNDQWACSLLQGASQDQPNNAQTLFYLAQAAFCVGKMAESQTDMQDAMQMGLPPDQAAKAKNFLDIVAACQDPDQVLAAGSEVQQVLSSQPDFAPALFAEGLIDSRNGDSVGAERDYEKILGRHPDCALAQKNLAILYAQNFVDNGNAYPVAVKAREAFPDDPAVARALALILFQRGQYFRAADLFNTISSSAAADARVFYCLGISEFHLKNYNESKSSLQRALDLKLSGQEATDARETLAELK